ncbi:dienelactone hydrolase family protein [Oscillochloris sp. ZM17-4]|uniref:dienelactone hydrolase family protein n=1 Tax=Oscillochloris sp. ZM17-4 TaxID=2866714 RepID=UPI001C72D5B4|nr:dienelactone hydrolase family protein [Oscillochloris sp. ZM17-4]MBX0327071.1 dienelactone hydrolase family protein [Oscillochloris sp. ZM17-4]
MCYDDNARPPLPPGATGSAKGMDVVLTAADGNRFAAYLATPEAPPSALVLVLPDVRGLHQFYKDLALRFAEVGVAAIAMDYFGRTAGLTPRDDSFEFWPHVMQVTLPGIFADAQASLTHMREQGSSVMSSFTMGFCMGGTMSFHCATQEQLALTGAIGFYAGLSRDFGGGGTMLERAKDIKVPSLGLFGGDDPGIPADQIAAFDAALGVAGVDHTVITYPGAPHSFFDRRATDFAEASADAWEKVLAFIAARAGAAV